MKRLLVIVVFLFSSSVAAYAQTCPLNPSGGNLNITTTSPLPAGTQGTAYSATLTGSGGTSPYSWPIASGTLPSGWSISSSETTTGAIGGIPTGSGASSFTARITESLGPP